VTPYYQDNASTIYHGDAHELLGLLRADVILTDFPYGIGLDYGIYQDSPEALDGLVASSLPLMRSAAPVVALTCGVVNQWRFPKPTWVLCWFQANAYQSTGFYGFNVWQPILCYGTDPYLRRGRGRQQDVVRTTATLGTNAGIDNPPKGHPCPKPLPAWRRVLLRLSPDASDIILDPFMGSGTTLRAAKDLGRKAVGIEIEERYCEIAANRLAQEVLAL
jgi:site-specific DNA-methyltransferase (adenine-specific)